MSALILLHKLSGLAPDCMNNASAQTAALIRDFVSHTNRLLETDVLGLVWIQWQENERELHLLQLDEQPASVSELRVRTGVSLRVHSLHWEIKWQIWCMTIGKTPSRWQTGGYISVRTGFFIHWSESWKDWQSNRVCTWSIRVNWDGCQKVTQFEWISPHTVVNMDTLGSVYFYKIKSLKTLFFPPHPADTACITGEFCLKVMKIIYYIILYFILQLC